jgi:hypothetical protein
VFNLFSKRSSAIRSSRRALAETKSSFEGLESRQLLAADLAVAFDSFNGVPAVLVPGDRLSLPIIVGNQGDSAAVGKVTINFYLSTNTTFETGDILLRSFADQDLSLDADDNAPGGNDEGAFSGEVTVPTLAPGNYFFLVRIIPNNAIGDLNQSNNIAASAEDQNFDWLFGEFNGRSNVKLSLTGADGTAVQFGMTGGGTGTVTRDATDNTRYDVKLENTGTNSQATFVASGGTGTNAGIALIDDVQVLGSINSIDSATGRLLGDVTVDGTINFVRFGEVQGPSLINVKTAGVNTAFQFGTVRNLVITSVGGISSIAVTSWLDTDTAVDHVQAKWITSLTSTGNFQAGLDLSGRPGGRTLDTVNIGGTASKGAWDIDGRGGNWTFKAVSGDWSSSVKNNLISLSVTNIFRGTIAAKTLSTITLGGLRAGFILAGADLGNDARRGGTDTNADTFSSGTINSLTVNGKVINAIVGAGLDPVDGSFKNGDDQLKTGRINNLVVTKTVSANSRFLARRYPGTGTFTINGAAINTAADRRFRLDEAVVPTVFAAVLDDTAAPTGIRVTFKDNQAINVATLGHGDLMLVGPGGLITALNFVTPTPVPGNGPTVVGDYLISIPGGTWDAADNGDYQIVVVNGAVKDVVGNAVAEGAIASFTIAL